MLEEIVKKYCKNSNVDFISPRNRDNNLEKKNGIFQLLLCNREQVGGAIDVSKTYECM